MVALGRSQAPKADNFEDSFWGWLRTPMRNLGIVWLVSYICDQFQLVMAHGGARS